MAKNMKIASVQRYVASIGYALEGIKVLLKEPNTKIHFTATVIVIAGGIIQHIPAMKWVAIIFAIAIVWLAEAFNTAIEHFCDLATDGQYHPVVKIIKDISAGAVLIAAAASAVTGIIVFTS